MNLSENYRKSDAEGGCGVVGFASEKPLPGRLLKEPLKLMHNRGNGKGGGIAACGCFPAFKSFYAIHIGLLKSGILKSIEAEFIFPYFFVEKKEVQQRLDNYTEIPGLEIEPPEVIRYFCRVKTSFLEKYARERGIKDLQEAEDQFVFENSYNLNKKYYADINDKAAFVLSHGKNLMILKGVGYAEQFISYYCLENFISPIWIGHQRYPTRGRLWHPGGAHPFSGLNEALVHNGDFANYYSVSEYLAQKKIYPLFMTDTEVSVLLFDYYSRTLKYENELIIEALAPTAERDFSLLSKQKQRLYRAIRAAHIHGSPDGPWFFIIARYLPDKDISQLIGITDTSMLRPHVFALTGGSHKIGLVASEKQAIDAVLRSLSKENRRICSIAENFWISRGGSHKDGGAFIFSLNKDSTNLDELVVTNKFGSEIKLPASKNDYSHSNREIRRPFKPVKIKTAFHLLDEAILRIKNHEYSETLELINWLVHKGKSNSQAIWTIIDGLTMLHDRIYNIGFKKRNWIQSFIMSGLKELFNSFQEPHMVKGNSFVRLTFESINKASLICGRESLLFIDASDFPQEGPDSVSSLVISMYEKGLRRFIIYNLKGDRFIGCGLGSSSHGTRIDIYDSPGDYLGSGIDGTEIYVHGSAQDQVAQIMNDGKIVIFGDVGQTFLYGAKGGTAFVMGNTAGRPLINSVGNIRAIINGTCLDYAAESFMAGKETGGGFIIINGLKANIYGEFIGLEEKYPGSNFFSLASGGAGYINDPYRTVTDDQLNGAMFTEFTQADWEIISPYLLENEVLFGIRTDSDLLTVDRIRKSPRDIFRKVISSGGILDGEGES